MCVCVCTGLTVLVKPIKHRLESQTSLVKKAYKLSKSCLYLSQYVSMRVMLRVGVRLGYRKY